MQTNNSLQTRKPQGGGIYDLLIGCAFLVGFAVAVRVLGISTAHDVKIFVFGGLGGYFVCGLIADRDYKDLERRGHKVECRDWACKRRDNPWIEVTTSRGGATPSANTPASTPSASR